MEGKYLSQLDSLDRVSGIYKEFWVLFWLEVPRYLCYLLNGLYGQSIMSAASFRSTTNYLNSNPRF